MANAKYAVGDFTYSYWDVGDQIWGGVRESAGGALDQWETADDFARFVSADALAEGKDPSDVLSKNTYYKRFSEYRTNARHALLAAQPDVAAQLRVWYGVNIPKEGLSSEVRFDIDEATRLLYDSLGIQQP